jgi:hypothetical protein
MEIVNMIKKNKFSLEDEFVDIVLKTRGGTIYIPFYAKWYYEYILKEATTGIYFEKINVKEVFVFETPTIKDIEDRKKMVTLILNYLLQEDRKIAVEKNTNCLIYFGIIIGILFVIVIIKRRNCKRANGT